MLIKHSKQTTYTRGERTAEATAMSTQEKKSCLNQDLFYRHCEETKETSKQSQCWIFHMQFFLVFRKRKSKLVAKTSMNLWRRSKSSNAKRAATRLEASKVRCRMRKTRFQQVLSTAKTPAALTHRRRSLRDLAQRFCNSKRTVIQKRYESIF